jgi:hypothetical protein
MIPEPATTTGTLRKVVCLCGIVFTFLYSVTQEKEAYITEDQQPEGNRIYCRGFKAVNVSISVQQSLSPLQK